MLRIVVDTNVIIRALFYGERHAQRVLQLIMLGHLELQISDLIEEEALQTVMGHCIEANIPLDQARPALNKVIRLFRKGRRCCIVNFNKSGKFFFC